MGRWCRAGCSPSAGGKPPARDYLRITAPSRLVGPSADDQAALDAVVRSDKVAPYLRSSSAATATRDDGPGALVFVLVFTRAAVNSSGSLGGFVDGMVGGSPTTHVRLGAFDATGFQRGGFAGIVWIDDDPLVAIRGLDSAFVTDVARAIVTARRSAGMRLHPGPTTA